MRSGLSGKNEIIKESSLAFLQALPEQRQRMPHVSVEFFLASENYVIFVRSVG
jgi:hypothetical protein